ncbi:MAG TPA: peptidase M75 [Oscillatoriales cyanobacterium M59_W2019_021]|nr:MAG: peptidase M75 [Cyanobacteria bacterium J055]HIK33379.1 peptidase M75 [Oscillatoriales cyanobacterium M4454_W2019_049]HIK52373.1 peptidase M75 [Oscillatoriales cyanobacterium M59_W2019_021]
MSQKTIQLLLAVTLAGNLVACNSSSSTPEASDSPPAEATVTSEGGEGGEAGEATADLNWGNQFEDRQVIASFADNVVLPKYARFSTDTAKLSDALDAFAGNPSEETLAAAREAWIETRSSWEMTESFAFGPAGSLGYDGAMDTWPINETDIQKIIESEDPLTAEAVAGMQDSQKGMHAIEYLLFGVANNKSLDEFSDRQRQYLSALGQDLEKVSEALLASWQKGIDGQPAYREVLAKAGEADNSIYPTVPAGAQEMVTGLVECLNEVAVEKLGVPMEEKASTNLESRFSFNTLNDLKNNVAGAQNLYQGKLADASNVDVSLSGYVTKVDPSLNAEIETQFQEALAAINNIPAPLEKSVSDPAAEPQLEAAKEAIETLQQTIEQKLVPLI